MLCKKCGTENENGAKLCKKCGTPLGESCNGHPKSTNEMSTNASGTDKSASSKNINSVNALQITEKLKIMPKKILFGVCAAIVAVIVVIAVALNAGKTINLNKYLTIEASGYNGYGSVSATIDWTAIEKKYGSKLSFTKTAKNEYGGLLSFMTPMDALQEGIMVELDKSSNLSNGDTVTYTWDINDEVAKAVNYKIKHKDDKYSVSDLAEIESFDAFADLNVEFSGIAPNGSVEISYNGSGLSSNDFKCNKSKGLRNGDIVDVTLSNTNMGYYANKLGAVPDATSKTYTVSGLQEYISAYSDLTDDFLSELKKEAEDTIYAYTAGSYSKTSALSNLEYAGYILNSIKDVEAWDISSYNNFYVIYEGDVSSSDGSFTASKVYFPVKFSDILKEENGNLSYSENKGIVGSSRFDDSFWYTTDGYINPLTCYIEIVENNRDNYTSECGDGFEVYAKHENIEKLDDISDEYKQTLYADAKDRIDSHIAKDLHVGSSVENLTVAGEYLLTAKSQGNDFKDNNKYYIVYSGTVSNSNGAFETSTIYFPVEYDGVVKLPDGKYMVTVSKGIIGKSNLPNSFYYTDGYIDGTEMYSEIVTSNRDNYTYEVSDGLKEFGN